MATTMLVVYLEASCMCALAAARGASVCVCVCVIEAALPRGIATTAGWTTYKRRLPHEPAPLRHLCHTLSLRPCVPWPAKTAHNQSWRRRRSVVACTFEVGGGLRPPTVEFITSGRLVSTPADTVNDPDDDFIASSCPSATRGRISVTFSVGITKDATMNYRRECSGSRTRNYADSPWLELLCVGRYAPCRAPFVT